MGDHQTAWPDFMTVGQLARRMGTTPRTLQYYDQAGLLEPSELSSGGRRLYTAEDAVRLQRIQSMKSLGFSLDDIRTRLLKLDAPADIAAALSERALAVKAQIQSLTSVLASIETLRDKALTTQTVEWDLGKAPAHISSMRLVDRGTFGVCGWAVDTTLEDNDRAISALYDDFFGSGKETRLRDLDGSQPGYVGLCWYTQGHDRYSYLLGVQADPNGEPPAGAIVKTLGPATWAVASYPTGKNIIDAWTEFFYTDIPQAGYAPNEEYNLYFEYYPGDVHGNYQLWVPVVPAARLRVTPERAG